MSNGTVSADELARKAQIDAVNRDYVLQPRLGIESIPYVVCLMYAQHLEAILLAQIIVLSEVSVGPWSL